MLIYNSSKTATLANVTLHNLQGNTTTTEGASAAGLTVQEDLSNFVQCGQAMATALTKSPELFYNAVTKMLETVGAIYFELATAEGVTLNQYDLQVSSDEFACLREKVRINDKPFEASFVNDKDHSSSFSDMFEKHPFTFDVKVWGNKGYYRTQPFTISYEMFKTSVQSREGYSRLISAMWAVIDCVVEQAMAQSPWFCIRQQIANAALYRGGVRVINLAAEYKKAHGVDFAGADDSTFAKWFVQYQRQLRNKMRKKTNKFSGKASICMNTPPRYERRFLIDTFYDDIQNGLSGVYHDDKIGNLDDYEIETEIQNVNEPRTLDIVPANPPVLTSEKHVTGIKFDGTFVGMVWDKRGTFWSMEYRQVGQQNNDFDKHINYISTVGASHCVDEDSNVIVFVIDTTKTGQNYNKGYTITEESDE